MRVSLAPLGISIIRERKSLERWCRFLLILAVAFFLLSCDNTRDMDSDQDKNPRREFEKTLFQVQSPDKKRSARVVLRGGLFYFIVDGIESQAYKGIGIDPPVFSPDSQHIAYVIKRDNRAAVVLDGKESESFLDISAASVYGKGKKEASPEAHEAKVSPTGGWLFGKKGLVFSPDSSRLAFCAWLEEQKMVVVVDGKKGPVFDGISSFGVLYSPDSRNIAYVAKKSSLWHVVINDEIGEGYEAIGNRGLKFSPGWDRVAFRAKRRGWETVEWQLPEN